MEEPDLPLVTPRGMAAPPSPHPKRRFEGDPTRPATIRIEATPRIQAERQRALEHELFRLKAGASANQGPFARKRSQASRASRLVEIQQRRLRAFLRKVMAILNRPIVGRSAG